MATPPKSTYSEEHYVFNGYTERNTIQPPKSTARETGYPLRPFRSNSPASPAGSVSRNVVVADEAMGVLNVSGLSWGEVADGTWGNLTDMNW